MYCILETENKQTNKQTTKIKQKEKKKNPMWSDEMTWTELVVFTCSGV